MSEELKYVVMDLEANGLLYEGTEVHCMVLRYHDGDVKTYTSCPLPGVHSTGDIYNGIEELNHALAAGYHVVGHNIEGFDFPLLKKLGYFGPTTHKNIIDTYIGVSLRYPEERPGLGYWGEKFGVPKPVHEDWSVLTPAMVHRCEQDTLINELLFKQLIRDGYLEEQWTEARALEQEVLWVHAKQTLVGMRIDVLEAASVLRRMDGEIRRLTVMLHKDLPKACVNQGELKAIFKSDGNLTHHVNNWGTSVGLRIYSNIIQPAGHSARLSDPTIAVRIGGPFSRIDFEPVNLNSHPKVKGILSSLGWEPTKWNYKKDKKGQFERDEKGNLIQTTPKLTEDSYDSLPEGLGRNIGDLLKLKHRRRFIHNETDSTKGLLSFVRDDGRVACDAFTCGTNTARYRHSGAFVNLPKVSTVWGPEIRSLFCVPGDSYLIGIDLDGIEARMMGHYASFYDGGAFAREVLKGDVHQMTAEAMGIDRETAKTIRYAISYGAGIGKVREILGCSTGAAQLQLDRFWQANLGLAKLISALEAEYASKGYITGIDGRPLYIRHKHKLFNTLIQNAATVVFKKWIIACEKSMASRGGDIYNVRQVLAYHDELGFEAHTDNQWVAAKAGTYLADQARIVGEDMNLSVPISAEAKVGQKYSQVH